MKIYYNMLISSVINPNTAYTKEYLNGYTMLQNLCSEMIALSNVEDSTKGEYLGTYAGKHIYDLRTEEQKAKRVGEILLDIDYINPNELKTVDDFIKAFIKIASDKKFVNKFNLINPLCMSEPWNKFKLLTPSTNHKRIIVSYTYNANGVSKIIRLFNPLNEDDKEVILHMDKIKKLYNMKLVDLQIMDNYGYVSDISAKKIDPYAQNNLSINNTGKTIKELDDIIVNNINEWRKLGIGNYSLFLKNFTEEGKIFNFGDLKFYSKSLIPLDIKGFYSISFKEEWGEILKAIKVFDSNYIKVGISLACSALVVELKSMNKPIKVEKNKVYIYHDDKCKNGIYLDISLKKIVIDKI